MVDLTQGQLDALHNLARKRDGEAAPYINIADARALTELGLAARTRDGWRLTSAGGDFLARSRPHDSADGA